MNIAPSLPRAIFVSFQLLPPPGGLPTQPPSPHPEAPIAAQKSDGIAFAVVSTRKRDRERTGTQGSAVEAKSEGRKVDEWGLRGGFLYLHLYFSSPLFHHLPPLGPFTLGHLSQPKSRFVFAFARKKDREWTYKAVKSERREIDKWGRQSQIITKPASREAKEKQRDTGTALQFKPREVRISIVYAMTCTLFTYRKKNHTSPFMSTRRLKDLTREGFNARDDISQ